MSNQPRPAFDIELIGPPEDAVALSISIECCIDPEMTNVIVQLLDRSGRTIAFGSDAWDAFRRNAALDTAKLLARELEKFMSPF